MDQLELIQTVGVAVALIVLVASMVLKCYLEGRAHPPGPRCLPIIGHLHLLGGIPVVALQKLAQKYGPLMYLKLGSYPTIVVTSPELAKEVLKDQDHVFYNRPRTVIGHILFYQRKGILWSDVGPYWRLLRKFMQTELMSSTRLASYKNLRKEEVICTLKEIVAESKGTQVVQMDKKIEDLTINNITRMMWSKKFFGSGSEGSPESEEMRAFIRTATEVSGLFLPGEFMPFLRWLDIGGIEAKMWKSAEKLNDFISLILEEHRINKSRKDANHVPDSMDLMLSLAGEDKQLQDEDVKAFFLDMILGGSDTSSNGLQWTLAELMKNPHMRKRAQDELLSVVGPDRLVEESDLPNLPYLQAVIKEAFRLHPTAPAPPPGVASEDTQVGGYRVPKGTRILVNTYAIQRDPSTWDRPLEFDPERFLNKTIDLRGGDFTMIPFGAGKRICPGMNLGMLMVQFPLAQFLHTCDWSLPSGQNPQDIDMGETGGLVMPMRTPLKLVATPRLSVFKDLEHQQQ